MGTFNGNVGGGRFAAPTKTKKRKKKINGFVQVLLALALCFCLFMTYTFVMNLTHVQKSVQWGDLFSVSNGKIASEIEKMDEADIDAIEDPDIAAKAREIRQMGLGEVQEQDIEALREIVSARVNSRADLICAIVFGLLAVVFLVLVILLCNWQRTLCTVLALVIIYLLCVFSNIPFIKKYRTIWIDTAMSTMRHQGLATFYFPADMVTGVDQKITDAEAAQIGDNTIDVPKEEAEIFANDPREAMRQAKERAEQEGGSGSIFVPDDDYFELPEDQQFFYGRFYELDRESMEAYLKEHPETLANGYEHIFINNSALGAGGTSIRTKLGEKVLAIDTDNQILLLEVDADGSRGVLAIAKDNSKLHLFSATTLPTMGQNAGVIAKNNGGILAMTGSGFIDEGGVGMGGEIAGYAMCDGKGSNTPHLGWGSKRLELHADNWFYLQDAPNPVGEGTTDAMEFHPGILINGKRIDPGIWTSQNPRACIGQSSRGEILMLCVEGRTLSSPGCSIEICADILVQHDGINAINCDGGTTAIMWYRGNPVMRCSNAAIPQGRYLPNAWVVVGN